MSLSPRGSTAVVTGDPAKGWWIMLIGGVLGWVSGQSWGGDRGFGEVFQLIMAFLTVAAMAVPAQLIAGRSGKAWLLATAGALGIAVPWFFGLAVRTQGQQVWGESLAIFAASWVIIWLVAALTRRVIHRWNS